MQSPATTSQPHQRPPLGTSETAHTPLKLRRSSPRVSLPSYSQSLEVARVLRHIHRNHPSYAITATAPARPRPGAPSGRRSRTGLHRLSGGRLTRVVVPEPWIQGVEQGAVRGDIDELLEDPCARVSLGVPCRAKSKHEAAHRTCGAARSVTRGPPGTRSSWESTPRGGPGRRDGAPRRAPARGP